MSTCLLFALLLVFLRGSAGFQDDSGRGFIVAELIHRDSSMSPFYNTSKTATERLGEAVTRSLNRINTFNSSQYDGEKDVISLMKPDEVDYLMKIYIGNFRESHQALLVMASTGSTFTWIDSKLADKVHSYETFSRDTQECEDLPKNYPGSKLIEFGNALCIYQYSYRERVETEGMFSGAEFHLNSVGDDEIHSHDFYLLFGSCTNRFASTLSSSTKGMAGLGHGDLSLISQLVNQLKIEKRFSYCLVPLGSDSSTHLVFGKSARFPLPETQSSEIPFRTRIDSPYYYLTLESVSVRVKSNKEKQKLQEAKTQTLNTDNNMIIDFGTTVTSLDTIIFGQVRSFVTDYLRPLQPLEVLVAETNNPFKLCYHIGDIRRRTMFPDIDLHFVGNNKLQITSTITLKYENIFVEYTDNENQEMLCMNIVPAAEGEVSVLGNVAQVNFHVEFNLQDEMIFFTPTDCSTHKITTT